MFSLRDKALLVKLFYKKDESASLALLSYRTMRGKGLSNRVHWNIVKEPGDPKLLLQP